MKALVNKLKLKHTFLLCALLSSCAAVEETEMYQPNRPVHFIMHGTIPLILASINGKRAFFIVDTGASISILNQQDADYFGFDFTKGEASVAGFGGISELNRAMGSTVQIGSLTLKNFPFACQDMEHISAAFMNARRVKVAGVIGSDIFQKYKISINYRERTLSY